MTQIAACKEQLRSGTAQQKAVNLCWVLHLVGDIHQPLHCGSQLSEVFPDGDRGGNLALVRLDGGMPVRLHFAWDAMLGEELDVESLNASVARLQQLECQHAAAIRQQMLQHPTPNDWAAEGLASVEKHVYLQGDLRPAHSEHPLETDLLPNLSQAYLQNAQAVASLAVVTASCRLAATVSQSLR